MNLMTKKFPTILGLLLIAAGIFGAYTFFQAEMPGDTSLIMPKNVRITNIADNKFSVSWTTQSMSPGSLEYGQVGEKLTTPAKDERDTANPGRYLTHHVTVEGLQPITQYGFRIISGEKSTRFDNAGSPYTATTGPVIGATPSSQNFYGVVELASKQAASGSLVYLTLPGGATTSTVARDGGNYAFTLSTMRSTDLRTYIDFDPSATIASLFVESGTQQSSAAVSLINAAPVPTITLGQNIDFLSTATTPAIAQVQPVNDAPVAPAPVSIFNVEPLAIEPDVNAVSTASVTILNPKESGEILKTLRPEFRGTGTAGATLSIALTGQKAISDTLLVASDGTWSWAPVIDLKVGKQKIAISYTGSTGTAQKIEREFSVAASTTGLDPAFVSSPSASTTTALASSKPASASAVPRTTMPDTGDGVPVTGVIQNTLLTGALGIVIMVLGAALIAI